MLVGRLCARCRATTVTKLPAERLRNPAGVETGSGGGGAERAVRKRSSRSEGVLSAGQGAQTWLTVRNQRSSQRTFRMGSLFIEAETSLCSSTKFQQNPVLFLSIQRHFCCFQIVLNHLVIETTLLPPQGSGLPGSGPSLAARGGDVPSPGLMTTLTRVSVPRGLEGVSAANFLRCAISP